MSELALAKGFACECGTEHKYPAYVFAHWDEVLTHTCTGCGRRHEIFQGRVELLGAPAPPSDQPTGETE